MSISLIQTSSEIYVASGTSGNATLTSVAAGNLLVVVVDLLNESTSATFTVSDDKGNVWNIATQILEAVSGGQGRSYIGYVPSALSGTTIVTVTASGTCEFIAKAQEWNSNVSGGAWSLRQASSVKKNGTTSHDCSVSPEVVDSSAEALMIANSVVANTTTNETFGTATLASGWTQITSSTEQVVWQYKTFGSSTTDERATFTSANTRSSVNCIAIFQCEADATCWWPCCGVGGGSVLLLIQTTTREDIGGGRYANVAAYDGDNGTVLWYYDAGVTATGSRDKQCGRPLIDANGNVYVPWLYQSAINTCWGGLIKLDINGSLQWEYTTTAGAGMQNVAPQQAVGCAFDSDGNIVFTHPRTTTGAYFATKVDTSGSMLVQYPVTSGRPFNNEPIASIAVDTTDDSIYVIDGDVDTNVHNFSADGTTFIRQLSAGGTDIQIDSANGKLYAAGRGSIVDNTPIIFRRHDLATNTNDWTQQQSFIHADIVANQSFILGSQLALDISNGAIYACIGAALDNSPTTVLANSLELSSSTGALIEINIAISEYVQALRVCGFARDPVSGAMFSIGYSDSRPMNPLRLTRINSIFTSNDWGPVDALPAVLSSSFLAARTI